MVFSLAFLRKRRLELGMTQAEVAQKLHLSQPCHYNKMENGALKIKAEMLPALAKALRCKIQNFFVKNDTK